MAVITPFFDVVAGVAILAGRSSLLDTGIFKTANTNFTIRHLLALGFIGYGGWNLWKIERAQDKLKKTLEAEGMNTVRCNMCMWEGEEEDLVMVKDEDGFGKGCPKCETDAYLMDLEEYDAEDVAPYAGVFEKMEVTFKIQDADYATFYYTTEIPSGLRRHSDEHIVSYIWGDEYELQDDNWFYLPYDWNGVGEHYLVKVMNKTLKAESFGAEDYYGMGICDYGLVCDQNIPTPLNEYGICQDCHEQWEYDNEMFPLQEGAESFEAEKLHPALYRYKGKIKLRKGWTECQGCDDLVKMNDINFAYLEGYGNATVCDACVEKNQGYKRMDNYMRDNWTSWKDWGEKKEYSKRFVPVSKNKWGEDEVYRLKHDGIIKGYKAESFEAEGGDIFVKTFIEDYGNRMDGKRKLRTWISGYFSSYDAAMKDAKKEKAIYESDRNVGFVDLFDKDKGKIIVDANNHQRMLYTKIIYQRYKHLGDNPDVLYRAESFGAEYDYDFQNQTITTITATTEAEARKTFAENYDSTKEEWKIVGLRRTLVDGKPSVRNIDSLPDDDDDDEDEDEDYQMDNFGDMEYIILRLLTDEQLEDEYGEYMEEKEIGRKDLPQQLEDDYMTDGEAEYLREKYLDEEYKGESFGAESMLVQSDGIMVELMGFDGSYRSDGEVKVGYTTAAELGFEPKQLKPVMWVWDDIEGYGAFMATEDIRFV